ncbi:PspC domain-containing protein [Gemmatimonadota bacterium]
MEDSNMRKCTYCAENIKQEAIKCRYCGSELEKKDINWAWTQGEWCRVQQSKKIAGVCTGLAKQFESPILILPLRVFFVVSTLFYFFGLILYIVLWIMMPAPDTGEGVGTESHHPKFSTSKAGGSDRIN